MFLCPRKSRHRCIFFLLLICLFGVYLTYKRLNDADTSPSKSATLPHQVTHDHFRNNLAHEKNFQHESDHSNVGFKDTVENNNLDSVMHVAAAVGARNLENEDDYITNEERSARLKVLLKDLSPKNWKTALDVGDMMMQVKSELMDLDISSKLTCREIDMLKTGHSRYQNYYGKKNIDHVQVAYSKELVVKSAAKDSQHKIECMKMDYNSERCELMVVYNLLRELMYLVILDSPSIIKLEGFCLRGETIDAQIRKKGALILTEAGDQIMPYTFSAFMWQDKLKVCVQMAKLLAYLEESPVGSLGLEKLHQSDFVVVGMRELKLVDLDNIHIGEMTCVTSDQCTIPEMSRKVIKCANHKCQGRNALNNLLWMYRIIFLPLLNNAPSRHYADMQKFLNNIQDLKLSTKNVLAQLEHWLRDGEGLLFNEEAHNQESKKNDPPKAKFRTPGPDPIKVNDHKKVQNVFGEQHRVGVPDQVAHNAGPAANDKFQSQNKNNANHIPQDYERVPNANFPGKYDYPCKDTRVSWGCVFSIRSLKDAMTLCDNDDQCESFVIFSSRPEMEALMTMVMKNSKADKPELNVGSTLFMKKRKNIVVNPVKDNERALPVEVNQPKKPEVDFKTCLKRATNQTEAARSSRERRLLAHLGLKGITEHDWRIYAQSTALQKHMGFSEVLNERTKGGRFKVMFAKNGLGLKKAEFMIEHGPFQHHLGFFITYHLDRILGLYHTPPTVIKKLSVPDIQAIQGSNSFWEHFSAYNKTDGTGLQGVLTMTIPPVMRTEKISIDQQVTMVMDVVPFSRTQKSHLEYILLWALTKMMQPQHGYLGYKGHLIHFEADLAFNNLKKNLQSYFYNCQFPNSVYKLLVCYKCPDSHKITKVCSLGQEVLSRAVNGGFKESEVKIQNLSYSDLVDTINQSASAILTIVDMCIHTFTREKVLY